MLFPSHDRGGGSGTVGGVEALTSVTGSTGSGTGHSHNMSANFSGTAGSGTGSVLQPYLTIIYVIKT